MARTTIRVNDRNYSLSCGDGEEERLAELAAYVSKRINALNEEFGRIGDNKLMVMALLMMADEVLEALDRVRALEKLLPTRELSKLADLAAGQAVELAKVTTSETSALSAGGGSEQVGSTLAEDKAEIDRPDNVTPKSAAIQK